jgi:hypothetical protein
MGTEKSVWKRGGEAAFLKKEKFCRKKYTSIH